MTEMQTPPMPPADSPPAYADAPSVFTGPAPWSALAISAFVCALLGFLGVTAICGVILGIAGIIVTKGGKRKGRGLAIAAIPISVVTGLISVWIVIALLFMAKIVTTISAIPPVFDATSAGRPAAIAEFRKFTSKAFDDAVSDERFIAWIDQVVKKHGKLTEVLTGSGQGGPQPKWGSYGKGRTGFSLPAKFVNGPATIEVIFVQEDNWNAKLDEIRIDGTSPRGSP